MVILFFSPKYSYNRGGVCVWMYVGTRPKFLKGHLNHCRYRAFRACLFLTVRFSFAELLKLG